MTPEQERLALDAMPMLDRVVRLFLAKRPSHVDGDAVRGAAHEALVKAARTFNPGWSVPFEAWAYQRIAGAMIDELRSITFGRRGEPAIVLEIQPWDAVAPSAERTDDRLDLFAALADLSPTNRRVVLAMFAGYRLRELSGELGVTVSAVSLRRTTSLKRLRDRLAA